MTSETSAPAAYQSNPFQLFKPAFEAFKLCWATIITLILAAIGAVVLLVLLFAILSFVGAGPVANIILFVLGIPFTLYVINYTAWAVTRSMLSAVRGEKSSFKAALPASWKDPLKLFVTQLLAGLLIVLGFTLLIIPGFFATAFWSFAPIVTVDTGEWGWSALKKSREIMRGRIWDMLGASTAPSAVGIIMLVPVLGSLAYMVFTILILPYIVVRYEIMLELKAQPDWEKVPVSPWNYAAIIVGLLFGGYSSYTSYQDAAKHSSPVEINHKAY